MKGKAEATSPLSTLWKISTSWGATLNREELLPLIANRAAEALRAAACAVILEGKQGQLAVQATEGLAQATQQQTLGKREEGLCGWVVTQQATLFVRNMAADPRLTEAERHLFVEGQGLRTFLGTPLLREGQTIGVLAVFYFTEREVTEDDIQMLATMANQASIALDNARLYEEQVRRNLELRMLGDIGRSLSAVLDLSRLLHRILSVAIDIIGSKIGYLLRLDEETQELRLMVSRGLRREQVAEFHLRVGEGLAGWVVERGEPVLTNQAAADPRYVDCGWGPIQSALCVPLKARGRIIGTLNLEDKTDEAGFDEEDLSLLTALASQAAVAIENAELYSQLERRVEQATRELVEANRQLGKRTAEIEAMVNSMGDGVIVTDLEGRVVLLNPAAAHLLNLRRGGQAGQPLLSQIPHPEVARILERLMAEPPADGPVEVTLEGPPPRTLNVQVSPVRDEAGEQFGLVTVLTDVTQLKELDRIKTDLISFVSHELRAPLSSIMGYSSTLLRHKDKLDPAVQQEFLNTILHECDRLNRLTIDLLDISRIESGRSLELHTREVDLPALVQRVIQSQSALAYEHTFAVQIAPEAKRIVADEDKLEQILVNLVNNAIKYSPAGGTVTVRARGREEKVEISVSDEGLGIPPEQLPHLFERYHRATREGEIRGIGIGLYLVRHLVEAHGGGIWVESEVGKGTTFTFTLPQLAGAPSPLAKRPKGPNGV